MQLFTKLLSSINHPIRSCLFALASAVILVSCGGGSSAPTYTVGGTVSGLTSGSLVLKNNAGDDLTISANTPSFTFTTAQASGTAYSVTAGTRPSRLACDITNNTGTIAGANVTGVTITCISPVYVVNNNSETVSMYAMDATTGVLTALSTPTVATGNGPISITVNPTGTFAYVANASGNTVSMYAIDASSGQLTALSTPTVATETRPSSINVNPAGTFAYVTNETSNTVSMYAINATTGILTPLATPTVATGTGPKSIAVNPAGTFAYVAAQEINVNINNVSMYAINATTGVLTALTTPTVATFQPYSIAVNPAGTFAYVANDGGIVSMYAINATSGVLTALATPTVDTGDELFTSIAVNPAGTFAYLTHVNGRSVSMFSINATTGQLTALSTPTVSTGLFPISIAVNPAGTFAYVANLGNATVSMYSINATTGILTALATPTVATGNNPFSIAFK